VRPFVFLDRDGTLILEKNYLADANGVELIDDAAAALRRLRDAGFGIAVITNQSGVARGYFDLLCVDAIHARLRELLASQGASVDAVYVCPHAPDDACACRKPGTAMLESAVRELAADLASSFIIGDKQCDIDCGRNAGVTSILVRTGYGSSLEREIGPRADFVAGSLSEAVDWILRRRGAAFELKS
jgi:D-glycero-D-manno-heptose 1,7-bisphosphate phosphatase